MSPEILLTPPLLARRLIAGFVIPWMLSLNTCQKISSWYAWKKCQLSNIIVCGHFCTFLCLFAPPFPRPFPPFPLPWSGIFSSLWYLLNHWSALSSIKPHPIPLWFVLVLAIATTPLRQDRWGKKWKCSNQWERERRKTTIPRIFKERRRIHLSGIRYTWTFVISKKWTLITIFTRTILVTLIFSGHQHIC